MGDGFLIFGFQECPDNCPRSEFGLGFGIKWVGGGGGGQFLDKIIQNLIFV